MIVTRRRRKPFPWWRVVVPLLVIALIAAAFVWPVSRRAIAHSPLATPFDVAALHQTIAKRDAALASLQSNVTHLTAANAAQKRQIATLQTEVGRVQEKQAEARGTQRTPHAAASSSPFSQSSPSSGDLAADATPDMRRTAQEWAAMQPENAAKVVQKLPPGYTARIFALMSPDAAGAILDAMPPTLAAALTQEDPQLQR